MNDVRDERSVVSERVPTTVDANGLGDLVPLPASFGSRLIMVLLTVTVTVLATYLVLAFGWFGDGVALAMPLVLALLAVVVALVVATRPGWLPLPVIAGLVTGVVLSGLAVAGPRWPQRTPPPVRALHLVAVNLQFDSRDAEGGVASTVAMDADVLVISELTSATDAMLRAVYPQHVVTDDLLRDGKFGQGVYSTLPLTRLPPPVGTTPQLLRVAVGGADPFVLLAVHLPRPTFADPAPTEMISFGGLRAAAFALDRAADDDATRGAVVIAGDLNLSDRTSGYRRLSDGRVDAMRAGWAASTYDGEFPWPVLLLRIDHILVPRDWCTADSRNFSVAGSDHHGVSASIGPCV